MTPLQIIVFIVYIIFAILSSVICANTFYVAFIKKKDEQLQLIVTKSMAQSFVILFILQIAQFIAKWFKPDARLEIIGMSIDSIFLSLIILSIILLRNRKKHSV